MDAEQSAPEGAHRAPMPCACGDHCFVVTTRALVTLVSPEDAHLLERKWWAAPLGRNWYAFFQMPDGKKVRMHRLLMHNTPIIDHHNGNGMDNRRSNLRAATNSQNQANRRSQRGSASQYKGVNYDPDRQLWSAKIRAKRIGRFKTPEEAATAYNKAALDLFGKFARLNVLNEKGPTLLKQSRASLKGGSVMDAVPRGASEAGKPG